MRKFMITLVTVMTMLLCPICSYADANVGSMVGEQRIGQNDVIPSSVQKNTDETAASGKETINPHLVTDIKEKTEDEVVAMMSNDHIVSSALNEKTGSLYVTFEEAGVYQVENATKDLINYIRLNGIKTDTVSINETAETKTTNETSSEKIAMWFFIAGVCGCLGFAAYKQRKQRQIAIDGNGKARGSASEETPKIHLSDVEGVEGLKADIMCIVDYLKNPDKYKEIGARVPKGIILYGPPGTGKTLLAKAVAGEADVPFFNAVGSDFVEKYVGVGAARVRDLYSKARKKAPCIVFIDEIDAVAGQRGESNSERDQTLNALLTELDGFKGSENIVTICATNRLDMLDSAFQRAGRFDLKLAVGLPDKKARLNILKIHGKNKKFSDDVNLEAIAAKTQQFSGADLEALLNESALEAIKKGKQRIDNEDIEDAFFKIVLKGNKKKREGITETNRVVAWHESGHTLATKLLTNDSVTSVTIVGSASGAGGVTFRAEKDDSILHSKKYLENSIKIMYAGRAAEEIYFGNKDDITTGASQDIKQATQVIREYLSLYGMGDIGMLDLTQFSRDFTQVIEEASALSKKLYKETIDLLEENKGLLCGLASALLEKETLEEDEIDRIIGRQKICA